MNKQELKQLLKDSEVKGLKIFGNEVYGIPSSTVLGLIDQLDEPEKGYAEQSPQYLKNILARLRELPLHDREVWLKAIMSEFERDFSHAKWRAGYEQGRIESMIEREKVKIPQFVADWIEYCKHHNFTLFGCLDPVDNFEVLVDEKFKGDARKCIIWCRSESDKVARAWIDGYKVEKTKETLYTVTLKSSGQKLFYHEKDEEYLFSNYVECFLKEHHTRKELEQAGFGWVFDCPGIEIEEV